MAIRKVPPAKNPYDYRVVGGVSVVIGAQVSRTRTVSLQLKDSIGNNLAVRANIRWFLSDDTAGDTFIVTAVDGGVAAGTNGWVSQGVAGKQGIAHSEANGTIDLAITHSVTKTVYMGVVLPDGSIIMTGAIAFS